MTERDENSGEMLPPEEWTPDDEELDDESAAESDETAESEPAAEVPVRRGTRAGGAFLGARRLLGRGRVAGGEEEPSRRGQPVRPGHYESRVHVPDRSSAVYSVVAAAALIGVLLYALILAPGGFLNPPSKATIAPLTPPPALSSPSASASASASASPSASGSASASPSASGSASGSASPSASASASPSASGT